MSIARINIEWRPLEGTNEAGHMSIVARTATQTNEDGVVISGNPSRYDTLNDEKTNDPTTYASDIASGNYGFLQTNKGNGAGSALSTTVDAYAPGTTEADRHGGSPSQISNDLTGDLDNIWSHLTSVADELAAIQFRYDPAQGVPPDGVGLNSNSLIASLVAYLGLDIDNYLTGAVPDLGWPGRDTILAGTELNLSGTGPSVLCGYERDDSFISYGAGQHIIHGDDGTHLKPSDTSDGQHDAYFADGIDRVSFTLSIDGQAWDAIKTVDGTKYTDLLYSIEEQGSRAFSINNELDMRHGDAGAIFQDKQLADIDSIQSQFAITVADDVQVTMGDVVAEVFNVGNLVGTKFADTFALNTLLDRTIDGTGGTDTVDFSGYTGGGMIIDLSQSLAQQPLAIAGAVTEVPQSVTLLHIENAVGTIHSDTLIGTDGTNLLTGGQGNDKLTGGLGADVFVFHIGDGHDTVTDYHQAQGDALQFTGGVVEANLSGTRSGNDAIIHDGSDTVTLQGFFTQADHSKVTIILDSGTINFTVGSDGSLTDLDGQAPAAEGPGGTGLTLAGTTGDDYLKGSDAADNFNATQTGNDTIEGHGGNDVISAGGGNDSISGGDGADNITTGNGNSSIDGGTGNDVISTGTGDNAINGGDGDDNISVSGTGNDIVNGGIGNDTIHVGSTHSSVDGGDGNDTILSSGNGSTLVGGTGDDSVVTDGGSDIVIDGDGQDNYHLESGSTATVIAAADGAIDTFTDDEDAGTLDLSASGAGITLTEYTGSNNLISSDLGDGQVQGFKHILGSQGDDSFVGSTAASPSVFTSALTVEGGTGSDYFENVVGSMVGGAGADTFVANVLGEIGGKVQDYSVIEGDILSLKGLATGYTQNAADLAHLHGVASGDDLNLDVLPFGVGGGGEQTLLTLHNFFSQPTSTEKIVIDFTDDSLGTIALNVASDGTLSQDTLTTGTSGDDTLAGTSSTDAMLGFAGNDTLTGGAGSDTLDGGTGTDSMTGGTGDDTYIVDSTFDVIVENSGEGTDTALASDSYTLSSNVENLVLTGNSAIDGTGNTLDNIITGNASDNTLTGGSGSDTYMIGNSGGHDVISDSAGTLDTIQFDSTVSSSSVSYVRSGDDLIVVYGTGGGSITVSGFFTSGDSIEQVTFSDSTVHNASYINAHLLNAFGTTGDDNLAGTNADDTLTGLAGNDTITALAGDDTLDGGTGTDTLIGGTGDDVYIVDNAGDVVTENSGEGTDSVQSSITYTLPTNVENLTLTGTSNINGTGNSDINVITGNSGNNVLDGGAGADTLTGGGGNDTFIVDNSGDVVTAGTGTDTIQSSITWDMSASGHNNADVENLVLTGSANINGTGNSLDDVITSNTGIDTLAGGLGNDTYILNNAADIIVENAGEGTDTVQANFSYSLTNANLDNLVLAGTANINGTGNASVNIISGNTGANILDGGAGADTLIGGGGNDTFIVDNTGDIVTAGSGIDTIEAGLSWDMSASGHNNSDVENLTITSIANNLIATGNSLGNIITSSTGIETLVGGLGDDTYFVNNASDVVIENAGEGNDTIITSTNFSAAANIENVTATGSANLALTGTSADNLLVSNTGRDTLTGGDGNDTYVVNNASDVVVENPGQGTDLVQTTVSYTLSANIEQLALTGTSNINGTGNSDTNVITGNSGNNVLDGGSGADTLTGGGGNDTFVVDNAGDIVTAGSGIDTIQSSISWDMSASGHNNADVENLALTTANITGIGNSLDNTITNVSGFEVTMEGGSGNDTYVLGTLFDVIVENSSEGTDVVLADRTYTLTANVENLIMTVGGTGTGNSLDNTITATGTSAITMAGQTGNDTYVVNNTGDVIVENGGEGTDVALSSVTYTIGANVENLTLTGSANINGTGNTLVNIITGNVGDNTLNGGTGADTMIGGLGNDTYFVDNASDVVTEASGEGQDTISVGFSYTLPANVEGLIFTGSSVLTGTGNALDNTFTRQTVPQTR